MVLQKQLKPNKLIPNVSIFQSFLNPPSDYNILKIPKFLNK